MAGTPCQVDTCSITSFVDGTGKQNMNVRLNPTGGIECATDNSGLQVKIVGDPAASVAEACQLLGITSGGDLFAARPKYEIALLSGARVDFHAGAVVTANSLNKTVTNNGDCARLVIATTKWQFIFEVDDSPDAGIYASDGTFFVDFSGISGFPLQHNFEIGGQQQAGEGTKVKTHDAAQTSVFTLGAGASTTVKTYGVRGASSGQDDYNTNGSGTTPDLGLTASVKFLMVDLAAGNLFSVV